MIFKKNVSDNPDKWGPQDANGDGIVTPEENKAYKTQTSNNRKTVKAVNKSNTNIDTLNKVGETGFYNSNEPPAGLNAKEQEYWRNQKTLYEKGSGTTVGASSTSSVETKREEPKKEEPRVEPTKEEPKSTGYTGVDSTLDSVLEKAKEQKNFANRREAIEAQMAQDEDSRKNIGTYDEQNASRINGNRTDQNTKLNYKYNVNAEKGVPAYMTNTGNALDMVNSIKNYQNAKNNDAEVKNWNEAKDFYGEQLGNYDKAKLNEKLLRGNLDQQFNGEIRANDRATNKLNRQSKDAYDTDIHARQNQLDAYNKSLSAYDNFIAENGDDPEKWNYETRQLFNEITKYGDENGAKAFNQSLQNRTKIQNELDELKSAWAKVQNGEADLGDVNQGDIQGQINDLAAQTKEVYANLNAINTEGLESIGTVVENVGTPMQKKLYTQALQLSQAMEENTGFAYQDPETRQKIVQGLQRAQKGLKNEINNDLEIGDARREMNSSINKFLYYGITTAIDGFLIYVTAMTESPAAALGQINNIPINQYNAKARDTEANFKNSILNNEAENIKRDQTGQSTADYTRIQNAVELEQYAAQKGIDSEQVAREMQGLKKAYDEYQKYGDGGFKAFYTANILANSNNNGVAGLITSLIQAGSLNFDTLEGMLKNAIESHADGGIVGETSISPEQQEKLFGIINNKGKTCGWMDKAFDTAKGYANGGVVNDNEQIDPTLLQMKQGQLQASLQQKMQPGKPMQSLGPAPAKGWGKK